MAIPNAEHLIQQAERLVATGRRGPPRQADTRRAISSAYYSLFHFISTCLADAFVGASRRAHSRYGLVYRSIDHRGLRDLCNEIQRPRPSAKYAGFIPASGFGSGIREFARVAVYLQARRHEADYDPAARFDASKARTASNLARNAIQDFRQSAPDQRETFLALLLCPPR